jgi:hypothetical protein
MDKYCCVEDIEGIEGLFIDHYHFVEISKNIFISG